MEPNDALRKRVTVRVNPQIWGHRHTRESGTRFPARGVARILVLISRAGKRVPPRWIRLGGGTRFPACEAGTNLVSVFMRSKAHATSLKAVHSRRSCSCDPPKR
jgi:hypothetical protein